MSQEPARTSRIIKHVIPVDDKPHEIVTTMILHVDAQRFDEVSVWSREENLGNERKRKYTLTVVGTGHEFDVDRAPGPIGTHHGSYYGTAVHSLSGLVWHLVGFDVPA